MSDVQQWRAGWRVKGGEPVDVPALFGHVVLLSVIWAIFHTAALVIFIFLFTAFETQETLNLCWLNVGATS